MYFRIWKILSFPYSRLDRKWVRMCVLPFRSAPRGAPCQLEDTKTRQDTKKHQTSTHQHHPEQILLNVISMRWSHNLKSLIDHHRKSIRYFISPFSLTSFTPFNTAALIFHSHSRLQVEQRSRKIDRSVFNIKKWHRKEPGGETRTQTFKTREPAETKPTHQNPEKEFHLSDILSQLHLDGF